MSKNTLAIQEKLSGHVAKGFLFAKKQLQYSNIKNVPMGAALLRGNKIIAVGYNKKHIIARFRRRFPDIYSSHAEMTTIINALNKYKPPLTGCELFVYSERKDGEPRDSKPCNYCLSLCIEAGIKRVWFIENKKIKYIDLL